MTRARRWAVVLLVFAASASPAAAQTTKINGADTAWMIGATGLVLMMTIPGLALFYAGMVRKKNVLATMAQSLAATFLVSILWALAGYSLTFTGEGAVIGTLDRFFLHGMMPDSISPLAKTIPESLFMIYQMTFAIITVALVAGSVADRLRFSAFLVFCTFWLFLVYVPIAHWVWGGGFLGQYGMIDFAGGTVVHLNAGVAGLVAAYVIGARHGYGSENLAPHDLTLAVIGMGLLWVGWFGFNGGSALGANPRAAMAIVSTHLSASTGAATWMALEWWTRGKPSVLGMISGAVAGLGTITPASGFVMPMQAIIIGLIAGSLCFWACTWLKREMRLRRLARRVRRARHRRADRHFARRRVCGRRRVGESGAAGRRAWPDRRQSAAVAGAALRRRRHHPVVGDRHLHHLEVDQRHRAAACAQGGRGHGSRRLAARRGAAIGRKSVFRRAVHHWLHPCLNLKQAISAMARLWATARCVHQVATCLLKFYPLNQPDSLRLGNWHGA